MQYSGYLIDDFNRNKIAYTALNTPSVIPISTALQHPTLPRRYKWMACRCFAYADLADFR